MRGSKNKNIPFYCDGRVQTRLRRPRKDKIGVDLISDVLPFGCLWYGEPNAVRRFLGSQPQPLVTLAMPTEQERAEMRALDQKLDARSQRCLNAVLDLARRTVPVVIATATLLRHSDGNQPMQSTHNLTC